MNVFHEAEINNETQIPYDLQSNRMQSNQTILAESLS